MRSLDAVHVLVPIDRIPDRECPGTVEATCPHGQRVTCWWGYEEDVGGFGYQVAGVSGCPECCLGDAGVDARGFVVYLPVWQVGGEGEFVDAGTAAALRFLGGAWAERSGFVYVRASIADSEPFAALRAVRLTRLFMEIPYRRGLVEADVMGEYLVLWARFRREGNA
jgi:hypothetical protein